MSVAVKICGLSRPDMLEAALEAGAAYVGLVFYEPSPRNVSLEQGEELAALARGRATIVALTVNASDALLRAIANACGPIFSRPMARRRPSGCAR
jgi:phosphoribosylanthranilate isomerase